MTLDAFLRNAQRRLAELDGVREALWATINAEPAPHPGREVPARRLYSIAEAMEVLNRSRASIWRDIRDGRLRSVNIGRSVRITAESLDRMVQHGAPIEEPRRRLRVVERD